MPLNWRLSGSWRFVRSADPRVPRLDSLWKQGHRHLTGVEQVTAMSRREKKVPLPVAPFAGVPDHAKELFEILEMRSLTPDYFDRFLPDGAGRDAEHLGSWIIGLLHDSEWPLDSSAGPVALTPVIMLVSGDGLVMFDEASAEVVLSSAWNRMCRLDLKPVEDGNYQVFALSWFTAPMSVSERFPGHAGAPLDSSEIGIRHVYTHANPSTFEEIDRYWSRVHIPQVMHQLPSLLG